MEEGRYGGGLGVVPLVLVGTLAAGADDPAVRVALNVYLALAVGEGARGELLNESLVMAAQALLSRGG